jgi:hypothetical protein
MVEIMTADLLTDSEEPKDGEATEVKFGEILRALHNITQPERKLDKFPWKESLRVSHTYSSSPFVYTYPDFMSISLRTRQASIVQDQEEMNKIIATMRQNNGNNILVTHLFHDHSNLFPEQWSADRLESGNYGGGQICVSDFPFMEQLNSNEVSSLLGASVRVFLPCEIVFTNLTNTSSSVLPEMLHIE